MPALAKRLARLSARQGNRERSTAPAKEYRPAAVCSPRAPLLEIGGHSRTDLVRQGQAFVAIPLPSDE